jgi:hypothetical protein
MAQPQKQSPLGVNDTNLAANLFANSNSFNNFCVSMKWRLEQTLVDEFSHVVCLMTQTLVPNHTRLIAPARSVRIEECRAQLERSWKEEWSIQDQHTFIARNRGSGWDV